MKWQWIAAMLASLAPAAAEETVPSTPCAACAAWNAPQQPFRIFGNTYYVGTHELSAILVASDHGLVLIDGDLAESAPQIAAHIRTLGYRPEDIKLILNSHVHYDHAAGIAWLQRLSGARVAASPWSAAVLTRGGHSAPDDPQHDVDQPPIDKVTGVQTIRAGQVLRVGNVALTAHFTPGHTPGGTSWSWTSCEGTRCLHIIYADSLTAVSADSYRFTAHPELVKGFRKSFDELEAVPCDILVTPHPGFSDLLKKLEAREKGGDPNAFVNSQACRAYVAASREGLDKRLAKETEKPGR